MDKNFYNILEVSENATQDEIKKSYRKLSLKWHPDKNPGNFEAVDKFQKINEAYETLEDEQKRREYDMRTKNPFFQGNGPSDADNMNDLNDIINNLFAFHGGMGAHGPSFVPGGIKIFPGRAGGQFFFAGGPDNFFGQRQLEKPIPIIKNISIEIEMVLSGGNIPIEIERWIIENEIKVFEKETIYVPIPKGIDDNEIILLKDKGNVINEQCKGDVKIFVKINNTTIFKRQGLDLILEKEISLKDSLCGFIFEIHYLNGKTYNIQNHGTIIYHGYSKSIMGMGLEREGHKGNLIINFKVKFPEKLDQSQIDKLREIL